MPPESLDPTLGLFAGGMMLLSMMAGLHVLHMRSSGSVLPYEPRRPVPWGPVGCVLAMTFLFMTVLAAFGGGEQHTPEPETASRLIKGMLLEVLIFGGFLLVVALFSKATVRDVGLPTTRHLWIRDACVGAAACLAALAPVIVLQELLVHIFFPDLKESGHPTIKALTEAPPSVGVFVLSGVLTVIVAPICEEIAFRLLLQGWLERWEDERLGWRKKVASAPPTDLGTAADSGTTALEQTTPSNTAIPLADEISVEARPPQRGLGGLPYGWFPIVLSSVAFGMAHFGYGPEPVPLFFLALVLGFLYQRTHRIIPSIVMHSLFNLFSMVILWRMLYCHG